jgi:hypothetical protein
MVELIESVQPEDAGDGNAWDAVARLTAWMKARTLEDVDAGELRWALADAGRLRPCDEPPEDGAELRAAVDQTLARLVDEGLVEATMRGLRSRRSVAPAIEGPMVEYEAWEYATMREWAIVMLGLAREDFAAGNIEDGCRKIRSSMEAGRALAYGPMMISHLVATGIRALAPVYVGEWLRSGEVPPEALDLLAEELEAARGWPEIGFMIESERIMGHDTIDHYRREARHEIMDRIAALPPGDLQGDERRALAREVADFATVGRQNLIGAYDVMMNSLKAYAQAHPADRDLVGRGIDIEHLMESLDVRYDVVKVLVPAVGRAVTKVEQGQVLYDGLRVMVALDRFKRDHAVYPESLNELVPAYLPALPSDPFAREGAFRYVRVDPHGYGGHGGYLLYCIGRDCEDNGGALFTPEADGHRNFEAISAWRRARGSDYIINLPDRGATQLRGDE